MLEPKVTKLEAINLEIVDEHNERNEAISQEVDFVCPDCGSDSIITVSHCKTCVSCGWSMCSL